MTLKLYEDDPYTTEFEALIERVDGEWISLDRTAFYPGGGGQDKDRGTIGGLEVMDSRINGNIEHRVPGHSFKTGQRVSCIIDWGSRYELMKAHTGEHLLFSALSRRIELELVKISLTPEKKSLIVKGEISWEVVKDVLQELNALVISGLEVCSEVSCKEDIDASKTRIKMDRIHGDRVRVVSIGDYDQAACTGIHVRNTREIGFIMITKFTSAKPAGDWELEFQVGEVAARSSTDFAVEMLKASETLGANPQDFRTAFENREIDYGKVKESLRKYSKDALKRIEHQTVGGMKVYSGCYSGIDRKLLMDKATGIAAEGGSIAILVQDDDKTFLVLSCSEDIDIDCTKLLNDVLSTFGGRGGGKAKFATGGTQGKVDGNRMISSVMDKLGLMNGS